MTRPALFLDRDGVVNVDTGYVHRVEEFRFCDGIFDVCREARRRGAAIVVVTNQAGIARGYYDENRYQALTAWMQARFDAEGASIDAVYHCPHHPLHGGPCTCRKPAPGMLLRAAREHALRLPESLLVGDKESDVQAGRAAGVRACVRVSAALLADGDSDADAIIPNVADLIPLLDRYWQSSA